MSEHTPGPWVIDAPEPESGLAMVEGTLILANGAPEGEKCVAECHSPTRMDADARLIAETPALLKVAEQALATLEHLWECQMDDRFPDMERWNDAMKDLRRTIATATEQGAAL